MTNQGVIAPCLQMFVTALPVKDGDWKSKASMTASYDFAMCI
jgi:hypothetical protein